MSTKRNGHYCYVCGRDRPHEKFSGWGHGRHICKDCVGKQDKDTGCHEAGIPDADRWEACPTVDEETVQCASRRKTGRSVALTELGYRVAEELLRRHGFGFRPQLPRCHG